MEGKALFRISVQRIGNLPLLGQVEEFPVSSPGFGTVVVAVTFFPQRIFLRILPNDLGVRSTLNILSPTL